MTREDFFESMNNIDASLTERADNQAVPKPRRRIMKIAAAAASFAVLAVGLVAVLPAIIGDHGDHNIVIDVIVWEDIAELFETENSNEGGLTVIEGYSFAKIVGNEYEGYKQGHTISADYIGEKICDTEVRTGLFLCAEEREDSVRVVKAELYEIKNISRDVAVAIRFLEKPDSYTTEHYYTARNTEYKIGSLSDFLNDFDAASHLEVGEGVRRLYHGWGVLNKTMSEQYCMTDAGKDAIREFILSLDGEADTEHRYDGVSEKLNDCDTIMRFEVSLVSAGSSRILVYVLNNGYLAIEDFEDNFAFFSIGRENTDRFYEIMKRNGEKITSDAIDPGGDGLVEETTAVVNESANE